MRWREPIALAVPSFVSVGGCCGAAAPFVVEASPLVADEPLLGSEGGMGARSCDAWTCTGNQPPGACVIFADSRPKRRGMEGPVRSTSRMPTEWPARERERASWVVMEDLPTPPLPERT